MNVQLTQTNHILLNEVYMTCLLKCSKSFPPVLAIYIETNGHDPLKKFSKIIVLTFL